MIPNVRKVIAACCALAALLAILLAGCTPVGLARVTLVPTPVLTLIPILQEAEKYHGLPPTATLPAPSNTPAASATPTRTPAASATQTASPSPMPLPPETYRFETLDQVILHGTYYRAAVDNAPLIVLVHQARGDQLDWQRMGYVQYLRNQGEPYPAERFVPLPAGVHFSVFTFDLRGHGKSEGTYDPEKSSQFMEDMRAAFEMARQLPGVDPQRIAAVGSSTGSAVLFRCPGLCAGVMSISLYPSQEALQAIQELDAEGAVVFCISEFACPEYASPRYVRIRYENSGHGYELLDPALDPPPGRVFFDFLQRTFGFDSG